MSKIVFLDIDGTLVDYEGNIPASAIAAVRKARKNKHKVYISTGRSRAEIYSEIWNIGFDGMIGGNGSYVESNGKVIMHQLISADQNRHIVDWLHERGLEFYLESNNGLFASEHFEERGEPVMKLYAARKGKDNADKITVRDAFPTMIFNEKLYRDDLNKVSFILENYQDYLDAKTEFPDLQTGTWGGVGETALFGDLGVKNITKAHAIDVLLKYLDIDKKDTIAIGDAKIDIPMLNYCHCGIAMGNGGQEIKDIADFITDDVNEDGIWNAFRRIGLF